MECSCIRGTFDIYVETLGCSTILLEDLSDWMKEDYYTLPTSFTIDVLGPGKKSTFPLTVYTDRRNKFSPSDFGQGGKYFLDGIYCFSVTSCGVKYQTNKAITCAIDCCLDDLISKLKPEDDTTDITRIKYLAEAIHNNTDLGKLKKANELYDIVQKFLRRLNCNCS